MPAQGRHFAELWRRFSPLVASNRVVKVKHSRDFFNPRNPSYLAVHLPLPPALWPAVQEWQAQLERIAPGHKYYHPRYLHVTAKLIGWADRFPVPTLADKIAEVAANTKSLRLVLRGAGVFPTCAFIPVLDPSDRLRALHRALCRAFSGIVPIEEVEGERFAPHVAVLSFNEDTNDAFLRTVERAKRSEFGSFTADRLQFVEARPYLNVGCYRVLREYELSSRKVQPTRPSHEFKPGF